MDNRNSKYYFYLRMRSNAGQRVAIIGRHMHSDWWTIVFRLMTFAKASLRPRPSGVTCLCQRPSRVTWLRRWLRCQKHFRRRPRCQMQLWQSHIAKCDFHRCQCRRPALGILIHFGGVAALNATVFKLFSIFYAFLFKFQKTFVSYNSIQCCSFHFTV